MEIDPAIREAYIGLLSAQSVEDKSRFHEIIYRDSFEKGLSLKSAVRGLTAEILNQGGTITAVTVIIQNQDGKIDYLEIQSSDPVGTSQFLDQFAVGTVIPTGGVVLSATKRVFPFPLDRLSV